MKFSKVIAYSRWNHSPLVHLEIDLKNKRRLTPLPSKMFLIIKEGVLNYFLQKLLPTRLIDSYLMDNYALIYSRVLCG